MNFSSRSSRTFDLPELPGASSLMAGGEVVTFTGSWYLGGMGPAGPESEGGAIMTVPIADVGALQLNGVQASQMVSAADRIAFFLPESDLITIHHAGETDSMITLPETGLSLAATDGRIYVGLDSSVAEIDPVQRLLIRTIPACTAVRIAPIGPDHLFLACAGGGSEILTLGSETVATLSTAGEFQAVAGSDVFARAIVTTTSGSRVVLPTGFAGTAQGVAFRDIVFVSSASAFALAEGYSSSSIFRVPLDGSAIGNLGVPYHVMERISGNSTILIGVGVDRGENYDKSTREFFQIDPADGQILGTAPLAPPPGIFRWP